ncbi:MAG: FecR domain-containing protein, partial [Candidatus Aminicenantales bacterium]
MKNRAIRSAIFGAILLAAAAGLWAAENYKVANGPKDFYFGHISYIEPTPGGTDPVVLREGGAAPEPGVLNLPIGPGDTIRTSGDRRCEIQFDTGTIVRLDVETEVRIETILARSLSSPEELSVLTLGKGRVYVMYKEYDRKEMFQVLTPNAAVKMRPNSVAMLTAAADGTTEAQVNNGR